MAVQIQEGYNDFFVVISAKHAEKPTFRKASISALGIPEIERGFEVLHMGQVFDEVFSYTFEPNLLLLNSNNNCSLNIPDLNFQQMIKLKRMVWLSSEEDMLGKTETNDYFLVLECLLPKNGELSKLRGRGKKDNLIVNAYLDAILQLSSVKPFSELLNIFRVEHPGLVSAENKISDDSRAEHVKPYLTCYYYYANLICWRLEREQIALKLQVTEEPGEHILKTLYVHRLRVINLCRYFLTNNRSSNLVVRDFCRSRVDAHKIKAKYNRYHDILTSCETYINNMNSLSQARGTKAVKKILHLLAFIAIPLGIFGAIMQMSPHHDIIENPHDVLTHAGIWFWVGFSFIVPLLLLTLGYIYDRYTSRHR